MSHEGEWAGGDGVWLWQAGAAKDAFVDVGVGCKGGKEEGLSMGEGGACVVKKVGGKGDPSRGRGVGL